MTTFRISFDDRHLLDETELDEAPWASCGPAALAALLGRPLSEIRDAFPNQREGRTWTNLQQMLCALDRLEQRYKPTTWRGVEGRPEFAWPIRGLAIVQWRGTWDRMPVNHPAQLQRTHWIAVAPLGSLPVAMRWRVMSEHPHRAPGCLNVAPRVSEHPAGAGCR